MRCPRRDIERFLLEKSDWIAQHRAKVLARREQEEANPVSALTDVQLRGLKKRAALVIPERVAKYHDPQPEDPLGKLQFQGKPEFQLPAAPGASGSP